jgi:hypothetical protein
MYVSAYFLYHIIFLKWILSVGGLNNGFGLGMSTRDMFSSGLWINIMMELTIRGLKRPDDVSNFCFVCPVKV